MNILTLKATCSLQERNGVKPKLLPSLLRPKARRADQAENRSFPDHPYSWASLQELKPPLTSSLQELKLLDKQTPEYYELIRHHHPFHLFPPLMKNEENITACQPEQGFKQQEAFRKQSKSLLKSLTLYIVGRSPRVDHSSS